MKVKDIITKVSHDKLICNLLMSYDVVERRLLSKWNYLVLNTLMTFNFICEYKFNVVSNVVAFQCYFVIKL